MEQRVFSGDLEPYLNARPKERGFETKGFLY